MLVIFFAVIIPQMFLQGSMDELEHWIVFGLFVVLFVLYVVVFIKFGICYSKLKKGVKK